MTIANTTTSVTVQGNGLTVTFSYAFYMVSADYAVLTYTDESGVESTITSSDFSITGVTSQSGGTFTYPLAGSPISTSTSLTLQRILPLTQDVAIGNQGNFYPSSVEAGLDYGIMVDQQLQAQIDTLTGSGAVTVVDTGAGLEGGPITSSGTISISDGGVTTVMLADANVTYAKIQAVSDGRFLGNFSGASATVSEVQFVAGAGVSITSSTTSVTIATSGVGSVTQVDTSGGLTGGPITSSGTVSIAASGVTYSNIQNVTNQRLLGNFSGGATAPAEIALIAGANMVITPTTTSITFAATTGSTASGTVTVIDTADGITGGPITQSGTVSLATVTTGYFLANFSGATAAPQGVLLVAGSGITFSGTTTSLTITASNAASAYVLITTSAPITGSTVTFSSIPSTYRHLEMRGSGRSDAGSSPGVTVLMTFNGDGGSNYDFHEWQLANATGAASSGAAQTAIHSAFVQHSAATANNFGNFRIEIENYTSSVFKGGLLMHSEFGATTIGATWVTRAGGGFMWRSTASITQIELTLAAGNWITGSFISLYGLL